MGDRGFAVGSCDADPGDLLKGIPGQIHLAAHLDALGSQLDQGWMIPGNARADHHSAQVVAPGVKALQSQGLPQHHLNALFGKRCRGVLEDFVIAPFEHNNVAILLFEQTRSP